MPVTATAPRMNHAVSVPMDMVLPDTRLNHGNPNTTSSSAMHTAIPLMIRDSLRN